MAFHTKTDADDHADRWEVHPAAEGIVSCLIGKIRLHLRPEPAGQQEEEVRLVAGTAAIIPRGLWHHIELDVPSNVMAITLPRGSRLETRTGAWKPRPARSHPAPSSTAAPSSTIGSATGRVVTRLTKTGER
ncbi:cupin [Nonomuraea sp. WAC 01424]|uniref:cupin n=1 Tax=Nonomuraea sp. WAC 01424 TaxID=2203200 RepID=UPI0021AE2649|nr:cupin [Nonomuraea sp. WAC 01424]